MTAQTLLDTLEGLGVTVSASGGKLRLEPAQHVPLELVPDLKTFKPDLLALLESPVKVLVQWDGTAPEKHQNTLNTPSFLERLPNSLELMVRAASNDALPTGPAKLPSGLVMDLNGYVLHWACAYLVGDTQEASRRLLEVYTALHGGKA